MHIQRHSIVTEILLTAISISLCVLPAFAKTSSVFERIDDIPDFKQNNPLAGFAGGGEEFCASTSLSDHLMWLGQNGYPKLLPECENGADVQISLIKKLAGKTYINTNAKVGTAPDEIMVGLQKYVTDCGYNVKTLNYQGFRPCADNFFSGMSRPRFSYLQAGAVAPRSCWLNIGWYKWDEDTDVYTRIGGHWVALVGYGVDVKGAPNKKTIIVHDPEPYFGAAKTNVYINLQKLDSGELRGNYKGLPQDADGYYWYEDCTDGAKVRHLGNYYGIIDGAIMLELAPLEEALKSDPVEK